MKRFLLLWVLACSTAIAYAQLPLTGETANLLTGTWKLVSIENVYPNGDKVYPYGQSPEGLLIFDRAGSYSLQIYRSDRIKVASGDKITASAAENAALVQGSNAHYGAYSLDVTHETITFNIKNASFSNWDNSKQERAYAIDNNRLRYVVKNTTQGGQSVNAIVVWERAGPPPAQ